MKSEEPPPRRLPFPLADMVMGTWVVLIAGLTLLGADLMWVVALGDLVRADWAIPHGVPFASAPQVDWPNPVVVAEVLLSVVNAAGSWALPALHLILVAGTLAVLVAEGRRMGGSDRRVTIALSLTVVGAATALVVVRLPMLSLLPFVLLVAILRRQEARPGRGIWLVPPLMVLWGNLHGGVLVGLAVLGVYVVAARDPRWPQRWCVGLVSLSSLLLTSAGVRTPEYYLSALRNEAAMRGTDLWAPLTLRNPFDIALVMAAVALVALASRNMRAWEWIVSAGLAVGTVSAARHGVWLLLFLAPVAAIGHGARRSHLPAVPRAHRVSAKAVGVVGLLASLLVVGQLVRRHDEILPPGSELVGQLSVIAGSSPVLAKEPEAETFAQAGIRVWAANPLDAFTRQTQGQFLDFLHGCSVPDAGIRVVVVDGECRASLVDAGWEEVARNNGLSILTRAP